MKVLAGARWITFLRSRASRLGAGGELAVAWLVAFIALLLVQHRYAWIPAYHDGIVHWDVADDLSRNLVSPFVREFDTGHPPLVSFVLALGWLLPIGKLAAMHAVVWSAAALLLAAVFLVGRRLADWSSGLCAAALTGLHPVVTAQALQLNLDLFVAAFAWLAILGAVCARPTWVAAGCTLACFAKLNGGFVLAPFVFWLLIRWRERWYCPPKAAVRAGWPLLLPAALFALYHLAKRWITGRWFSSAEFQDANLGLVSSLGEYRWHLRHSVHQYLGYNNGNAWALTGAAAGSALLLLRRRRLGEAIPELMHEPWTADREAQPFWRKPSVFGALLLMVVLSLSQLALWSLRHYPSLVRYFITAYPTLYLVLTAAVWHCAPRRRSFWVVAAAAPVALAFFLRAHPSNAEVVAEARVPLVSSLARSATFPPSGIRSNHENNLELIDQIVVVKKTADRLETIVPRGATLAAAWPFDAYFRNPEHGFVGSPFNLAPTAEAPASARLVFSVAERASPEDAAEAWPDHRVDSIQQRGRVWAAVLVPLNR